MQGERRFLQTSCGFCSQPSASIDRGLDGNRLRKILRKIMFAFVSAWSYSMATGA